MSELVWKKITCPRCNREVSLHLMSLAALCPCGAYYVDLIPSERMGWYASREAYQRGEARIQ